jgi:dihydrodipicolinate synthase/N-acetylneuraminate lyase
MTKLPSGASGAIWSATPTPFLANGELDDAGLERLCRQHERLRVLGLFLGGTCGEGPFMPNRQRAELVRKVRRLAGAVVSPGRPGLRHVCRSSA